MNNQHLSIIFILSFLISCSDTDNSEVTCINSVLESQGMEPYSNQEIQCEFYLVLYEFQNLQFFTLNSHCADIGTHILDCAGNNLCEDDLEWCNNFFESAKEIRIVGMKII